MTPKLAWELESNDHSEESEPETLHLCRGTRNDPKSSERLGVNGAAKALKRFAAQGVYPTTRGYCLLPSTCPLLHVAVKGAPI